MALITADRVREFTSTNGTGTLTLSGAAVGYQTFSSAIGNGNTTYYAISNPGINEWEVGIGTVGAGTLARTTVLSSSNSNNLVDFSAGTKDVFVTYPAEGAVFADNAITLTNKTISGASNTLSNIANSSLTNSKVTIGSTDVSLGATATTLAGLTSVTATSFVGALTGNADTVTNGVYTTGNQTIAGTKTFSDNPTLSAGTANGVAYLNGSKVLTSGSALTFDGTTLTATGFAGPLTGNVTGNVSGNAGTVTNGVYTTGDQTIGGTKTLSSNPIVSAGTANGVAYLNGSKVLTSGSALTFDGSNFENVNATSAQVAAVRGTQRIAIGADGFTNAYVGTTTAHDVSFLRSGSEQMRLTSTGLGIGTSSPSQKLHVQGGIIRVSNSSEFTYIGAGALFTGGSASASAIRYDSGYLSFGYSTTEQMRLDSSGNLGLGVTPSAWTSAKAIQVNTASSLFGFSNDTHLAYNSYYSATGYKYLTADYASDYTQTAGQHRWYTAPSGTAGNAISFTQAMTLDASGNFIVGGTTATNTFAGRGNITINGSSSAIISVGVGGTEKGYIYTQGTDFIFNADTGGLYLQTGAAQPVVLSTNGSERMRIDSSGNVGIGTSNPSARLHIVGNQQLIRFATESSASALMNAGVTNSVIGISAPFGTSPEATSNAGAKWGITFTGNGGNFTIGGGKSASVFAVSEETDRGYNRAVGLSFFTSAFDQNQTERMRIDSSGNLITNVNGTAPTLTTNSTMSFELTNNTTLKIKVRGTDGTTRSVTLTLA